MGLDRCLELGLGHHFTFFLKLNKKVVKCILVLCRGLIFVVGSRATFGPWVHQVVHPVAHILHKLSFRCRLVLLDLHRLGEQIAALSALHEFLSLQALVLSYQLLLSFQNTQLLLLQLARQQIRMRLRSVRILSE